MASFANLAGPANGFRLLSWSTPSSASPPRWLNQSVVSSVRACPCSFACGEGGLDFEFPSGVRLHLIDLEDWIQTGRMPELVSLDAANVRCAAMQVCDNEDGQEVAGGVILAGRELFVELLRASGYHPCLGELGIRIYIDYLVGPLLSVEDVAMLVEFACKDSNSGLRKKSWRVVLSELISGTLELGQAEMKQALMLGIEIDPSLTWLDQVKRIPVQCLVDILSLPLVLNESVNMSLMLFERIPTQEFARISETSIWMDLVERGIQNLWEAVLVLCNMVTRLFGNYDGMNEIPNPDPTTELATNTFQFARRVQSEHFPSPLIYEGGPKGPAVRPKAFAPYALANFAMSAMEAPRFLVARELLLTGHDGWRAIMRLFLSMIDGWSSRIPMYAVECLVHLNELGVIVVDQGEPNCVRVTDKRITCSFSFPRHVFFDSELNVRADLRYLFQFGGATFARMAFNLSGRNKNDGVWLKIDAAMRFMMNSPEIVSPETYLSIMQAYYDYCWPEIASFESPKIRLHKPPFSIQTAQRMRVDPRVEGRLHAINEVLLCFSYKPSEHARCTEGLRAIDPEWISFSLDLFQRLQNELWRVLQLCAEQQPTSGLIHSFLKYIVRSLSYMAQCHPEVLRSDRLVPALTQWESVDPQGELIHSMMAGGTTATAPSSRTKPFAYMFARWWFRTCQISIREGQRLPLLWMSSEPGGMLDSILPQMDETAVALMDLAQVKTLVQKAPAHCLSVYLSSRSNFLRHMRVCGPTHRDYAREMFELQVLAAERPTQHTAFSMWCSMCMQNDFEWTPLLHSSVKHALENRAELFQSIRGYAWFSSHGNLPKYARDFAIMLALLQYDSGATHAALTMLCSALSVQNRTEYMRTVRLLLQVMSVRVACINRSRPFSGIAVLPPDLMRLVKCALVGFY